MPLALPTCRNPFRNALAIWLAVWLLALVGGHALVLALGWHVPADGHAVVHAHGHPFVDARAFQGIPNALDVLSNLAFLAVGWWVWRRARTVAWPAAWRALAASMVLTAAGSAIYHWTPNPFGLLLDRLGMSATFAVVMAIAVAERWARTWALPAGMGVLAAGVASAALDWSQAQVLPWAMLQFGGLLCLCVAAAVRPVVVGPVVRWGMLIALYALAKVFELADAAVFDITQGVIAGHALKHLAAAAAVWLALRGTVLRQNAPAA